MEQVEKKESYNFNDLISIAKSSQEMINTMDKTLKLAAMDPTISKQEREEIKRITGIEKERLQNEVNELSKDVLDLFFVQIDQMKENATEALKSYDLIEDKSALDVLESVKIGKAEQVLININEYETQEAVYIYNVMHLPEEIPSMYAVPMIASKVKKYNSFLRRNKMKPSKALDAFLDKVSKLPQDKFKHITGELAYLYGLFNYFESLPEEERQYRSLFFSLSIQSFIICNSKGQVSSGVNSYITRLATVILNQK